MKNTITTTSQAQANYINAADRIMNLLEDCEFTSTVQQDPEMLRHTIAQLIRESIEGNLTFSWSEDMKDAEVIPTVFDPPECGCTCGCQEDSEAFERFFEEIEQESNQPEAPAPRCRCGDNCDKK